MRFWPNFTSASDGCGLIPKAISLRIAVLRFGSDHGVIWPQFDHEWSIAKASVIRGSVSPFNGNRLKRQPITDGQKLCGKIVT